MTKLQTILDQIEKAKEVAELIQSADVQIRSLQESLRANGSMFPDLKKKWEHELEIKFLAVERLEKYLKKIIQNINGQL